MPHSSATPANSPVEDTVAKIDNEFAVGSDLDFQHHWERLEKLVWPILFIFLALSLAGVFGRGPVANAVRISDDRSVAVRYERIQRFGTPSVITVEVQKSAIQDGRLQLWVSDELVKPLGNQRVIPEPERSEIGDGGILYTFAAGKSPASVAFQTQPSELGLSKVTLRRPGHSEMTLNIFVMP